MIEEQDLHTIEYLRTLTKMTTKDVKLLNDMLNKYIDKNAHICGHCGGQIRFAHRKFLMWCEDNINNKKDA